MEADVVSPWFTLLSFVGHTNHLFLQHHVGHRSHNNNCYRCLHRSGNKAGRENSSDLLQGRLVSRRAVQFYANYSCVQAPTIGFQAVRRAVGKGYHDSEGQVSQLWRSVQHRILLHSMSSPEYFRTQLE